MFAHDALQIGVDFALKELVLDGGRKVHLQLWDTAGIPLLRIFIL